MLDRGEVLIQGAEAIRAPVGLIAKTDVAFAAFVFALSADAFVFLGLHGALWALAYAWFVGRVALSFPRYLGFLRGNLVLLGYAGLSAVSLLWTDTPAESLRFNVYLTMTTAIALFLALRFDVRALFWLSGWTLFALIVASLANIGSVIAPAYHPLTGNFVGVFISKNALGQRAIEFATIAVFAVLLLRGVGTISRAAFFVGAALTTYMTTIAGSATATALTLTVVVLSAGLALAMQVRSGPFLLAPVVALAAAAGIAALVAAPGDPVSALFAALGKDPTMTGRTILWNFGLTAWRDRPVLGFGAAGFWDHPAWLARIDVMQRIYGETVRGFHSLPVELLVTLGPLGLLVHGLIGLRAVRDGVVVFRRGRDPYAIWALVMVAMLYFQAFVGPHLYIPHSLPLILLLAIAGALGRRARAARLDARNVTRSVTGSPRSSPGPR